MPVSAGDFWDIIKEIIGGAIPLILSSPFVYRYARNKEIIQSYNSSIEQLRNDIWHLNSKGCIYWSTPSTESKALLAHEIVSGFNKLSRDLNSISKVQLVVKLNAFDVTTVKSFGINFKKQVTGGGFQSANNFDMTRLRHIESDYLTLYTSLEDQKKDYSCFKLAFTWRY